MTVCLSLSAPLDGPSTGIAIDLILCWVYTFREGMVVKMEAFLDRAAALEAVGLSEQDAHADS